MSRPSPACFRCGKTHSGPQAFLIACSECSRSWHHRCHIPPISDEELIARIKATNENDIDNGLDGWVCKKCSKANTRKLVESTAAVSKPLSVMHPPLKPSHPITSNSQDLHSLHPPVQKDPAPKVTKYKQSAGHRGPAPPAPEHFLDHNRQPEHVPPSQKQDAFSVPGQRKNKGNHSAPATQIVKPSTSSSHTATNTSGAGGSPDIPKITRTTDIIPWKAPQNLHLHTLEHATSTSRQAQPSRSGASRVNLKDDDHNNHPFSSNIAIPTLITRENNMPVPSKSGSTSPSMSSNKWAGAELLPEVQRFHRTEPERGPGQLRANEAATLTATQRSRSRGRDIIPLSTHPSLQLPRSFETSVGPAPMPMGQHNPDRDMDMNDDDDLYGPLPEDLGIIPAAGMAPVTDMEVDDIQAKREPFDTRHPSSSEHVPQRNYNREPSWIHGRYTNILGDSWDRLLRSKNAPVPNRPRTKVQAKKLNRYPAGSQVEVENVVNFFIDEWLSGKMSMHTTKSMSHTSNVGS